MFAIERRSEILSILEQEKSVSVTELARRFSVSDETIRRDLEKLAEDRLVKKTYGGAVLRESIAAEPSYRLREKTNIPQKQIIADKVCALIEDNSHIMLDASSTAVMIARRLRGKKELTIMTNSVEILLDYANCPGINVISTGGFLRGASLSLVGNNTTHMLRDFTVDKTIISCKGIDFQKGVTESNESEMVVKRAMIECGKEIILAADSSKLNRRSFVKLMDLSAVDYLVTDAPLSDEWIDFLDKRNVTVI